MAEPIAAHENPEQQKYEQMWQLDDYRRYAPGEQLAMEFLKHADPPENSRIIDFGCGTGRGALKIASQGHRVVMLDFATNCLDARVAVAVESGSLCFYQHDLLNPSPSEAADYGYCTDVMEHIQPEYVDTVLENVLNGAKRVFFQISLQHDGCGALINETLHLTVKTMEWWTKMLRKHGAFIYYSDKRGQDAIFYVAKFESKSIEQNVETSQLLKNVTANAGLGLQQAVPHDRTDRRLLLLAGGPSLNNYEEKIKSKADSGSPIICTNGTYNWCLDRKIAPNGLIIVDARAHNVKFISEVIPTCKYMLASQCHPDVFAAVPAEQTYIWHSQSSDAVNDALDAVYGDEPWYAVPGGLTVTLRAISLLRMLGWWKLDIYGFDGCLVDDDHHAYEQTENEGLPVLTVTAGKREFKCHPWMEAQAKDFQKQNKVLKGDVHMNIYGDGLISHIANEEL